MDSRLAHYLESVAPHDAVAELVREMGRSDRSWHDIVRDERYARIGLEHGWFTNSQRATFYRLVTVPERSAFLDVGAGSGVVAACLSADYEKGYAIDVQQTFVDFMRKRFAEESITNVNVMHGNALAMPIRDESVDLVVMNNLLHWIPSSEPQSRPRQVQLRVLREARRCLKPGGKVVLAVDNAWYYRRLRSSISHFVRGNWGRVPREFCHSYFGYSRLVAEAGYSGIKFYVLLPKCDKPIDIYSFEKTALNELFRKYHTRMLDKQIIKAISDRLGVPYLWAFVEAAFYVEASR